MKESQVSFRDSHDNPTASTGIFLERKFSRITKMKFYLATTVSSLRHARTHARKHMEWRERLRVARNCEELRNGHFF